MATEYRGTVHGGVVVFDEPIDLPDGSQVKVVPAMPVVERTESSEPTIWQKLAQLGREAEREPCDLPEDLAANHDHYLHGLPKRK